MWRPAVPLLQAIPNRRPTRRGELGLERFGERAHGEHVAAQHLVHEGDLLGADVRLRERHGAKLSLRGSRHGMSSTGYVSIGRAGTPATRVPAGTSAITTAPAATKAPAPMIVPSRTTAPMPTWAAVPTVTRPPR